MPETDQKTGTASDGATGAADADLNKLKSQVEELSKQLTDSRSEVKTLISDRDKLKDDLRDLKKSTREQSKGEAEKERDYDKLLASYDSEKTEWVKREKELTDSLHVNVLKGGVIQALNGLVKDPEWVFENMKDSFELKDDGKGNLTPRVKDSVQDVKSYIEKTLTETKRDYLLLSGRHGGTGQQHVENNGKDGNGSMNLATLSQQQDHGQAAFQKDPRLAETVLRGVKLRA